MIDVTFLRRSGMEGEIDDSLNAAVRENRRLDRDLIRLVVIQETAHLRVLALGIFADHPCRSRRRLSAARGDCTPGYSLAGRTLAN